MSTPASSLGDVSTAVAALRTQADELRARAESATTPAAQAAELAAWARIRDDIRTKLSGLAPENLFAGLDASVPVALLPVRLETRFADPGTDVLHVRIFPDEVHVDGHDPALTDTELGLGTALWAAPADLLADGETPPATPVPADLATGRRACWAALVRLLGGPRAAWVAHATRPGATPAATKPQAYMRPPVARALPDRWLVRAYVGGAVAAEAWTLPVGVDLHLAPDPQATAAADPGLPALDPELQWLVDYTTAVDTGMAVDLPLPAGTEQVDRVVAIGVRATMAATDAATELASLLTAHRFTDGLGFLPAGSPTANTPAVRAAVDRNPDPDELWGQEFGPASPAGAAGPSAACALGLASGVLDGLASSDDAGDAAARAMQTALWPATFGYYLGELIDGSALASVDLDAVRTHFLTFVRGRGTLPVLRLGRQPYGVLPIVPLDRWTADGASQTADGLARLLQRIRPLWQYGVGSPVTASEGPGFDSAFVEAMSTDAVARGYQVRTAVADRTFNPLIFTGVDATPGNGVIDSLIGGLLGLAANPFLLDVFSPTAQPVRAPLVVDPTDPTPDATVQAAIRRLASANPSPVLGDPLWLRPGPTGPATVLHTLLRRSMLLEYAAAGFQLSAPTTISTEAHAAPAVHSVAATIAATSGMLAGLYPDPAGGFTPVLSLPTALTSPVANVTGTLAAGEWLWQNPGQHGEVRRTLDETLAAMNTLATLTAVELELLLPEALDLATHRWTAWAESIAADKLARLRATTPAGVALGGWGIVGAVSRRARIAVDPATSAGASAGPLWADTQAGGFVHAPSTAQAATAAVLRAAHLAHGGDDDPTCAVDLSSAPARAAMRLASGIRAGQELGALLGYELERDLHERGADPLVSGLRAYAPRWQASGTFVEGENLETIVSPSAVVDGLALANDDPDVVAKAVLPDGTAATSPLATALAAALDSLRAHQHGLADLFTAEALHQTLHRNRFRAGAALDAASRGGVPPDDFDVLRTPRSGAAVTCRLAVLFPAAAASLPGGWPDSPRGTADPDCSTWLASVLPPVASVRVRTTHAGGTAADAAIPAAVALGPLDVVLDRPETVRTRVQLALPAGTTLATGRGPAWGPATIGLDELLTVAAVLRDLIAARPLREVDLAAPGTSQGADERDTADLAGRVAAARTAVETAEQAVTGAVGTFATASASAAIAEALAVGVVVHVPEAPVDDDLLAALTGAAATLADRLAAPAPAAGASADELIAALQGLYGATQPAVPRLMLGDGAASAAAAGLAAGDAFLRAEPDLARDWFDEAAGVRSAAGRFAAALQDCDALTAGGDLSGGLRILEVGAGSAWSAGLSAADVATISPAASLVAWAGSGPLFGSAPLSGLLVDEWVEVVPDPVAATSVVYQAEAPPARAPQAILLGLAPEVSAGWDADTLTALVLEAADLAALRLVDAERGAWFGRMLPAVLLPDGDAKDVIAAPVFPLLGVDEAVVAAGVAQAKELG